MNLCRLCSGTTSLQDFSSKWHVWVDACKRVMKRLIQWTFTSTFVIIFIIHIAFIIWFMYCSMIYTMLWITICLYLITILKGRKRWVALQIFITRSAMVNCLCNIINSNVNVLLTSISVYLNISILTVMTCNIILLYLFIWCYLLSLISLHGFITFLI